jgi:hypothetical protein
VPRTLLVDFSLTPTFAPRTSEQSIAHFEFELEPSASQDLIVTCRLDERPAGKKPPA